MKKLARECSFLEGVGEDIFELCRALGLKENVKVVFYVFPPSTLKSSLYQIYIFLMQVEQRIANEDV